MTCDNEGYDRRMKFTSLPQTRRFSLNVIASSLVALAFTAGIARADLLLSGSTAGSFQASPNPNTVISNSPDGMFASFRTGVPVGSSFKSGVQFNGSDFMNIASGDTFSLGLLTYFNGITQIGTSSGTAMLDFSLNLSDPAVGLVHLTTVTFGIDATVNTPPNLIPDAFTASFTQPPAVLIGDQWVKFTINGLPTTTELGEDMRVDLGSVTVSFLNPVPEPATYGLLGGLGLMGLVAYRRLRANSAKGPAPQLTAA
jgi:PEP-CTERM motif-containing protein